MPTVASESDPAVSWGDLRLNRFSARPLAGAISALTLAVVLLPIRENWRHRPKDGFPLSSYPMFAAKRGANARCTYLVGYDGAGNRHCLPHTLIGAGGLNQVRRQLRRVAARGEGATICAAVAAQVGRSRQAPYVDLVRVELLSGDYCLRSYCAGTRVPLRERIVAEAAVPRVAR